MIEPLVILLAIGAAGGAVRSILGYKTQADTGESFDVVKFIKSIVRASIAGAALVYTTTDITAGVTTATYVSAFFTAIGADVFLKEIYGAVSK